MTVIIDDREKKSPVIPELARLGVKFEFKRLEVADYDVSGIYGIERKTPDDFLNSILDKRLFEQSRYLKQVYAVPVVIIEGDLSNATRYREVSLNQAYGAILALAENNISVVNTGGPRETALFIYITSRRTEKKPSRYAPPVKIKVIKSNTSIPVAQLNLVATLPGISYELAERILAEFKTPRKFFTATASELRRIPGLGSKKIQKIMAVLDTIYVSAKNLSSNEKPINKDSDMTGEY
ncbi:MAG: ERCC4 domain-containing protein [Infirmifilum sp.]